MFNYINTNISLASSYFSYYIPDISLRFMPMAIIILD
jgi:hypothetical protein